MVLRVAIVAVDVEFTGKGICSGCLGLSLPFGGIDDSI
jgi:hypothetical protein